MSAEEVIDAWIDPCGSDTGAGILDALNAAGFAVVELPAAQQDWHGGLSLWPVEQEWNGSPDLPGEVTIRKTDSRITITAVSIPFHSIMGARSLAAALLAAANAAEAQS